MWKSKFNSLHTVLLKSTGDAAYDFPDQSCTAYCNRAHPNHSQIHPDRMEKARRLRRRVNSQCGRRRKAAERGSDRRANHQSLKNPRGRMASATGGRCGPRVPGRRRPLSLLFLLASAFGFPACSCFLSAGPSAGRTRGFYVETGGRCLGKEVEEG
jgi:hypothetical protein